MISIVRGDKLQASIHPTHKRRQLLGRAGGGAELKEARIVATAVIRFEIPAHRRVTYWVVSRIAMPGEMRGQNGGRFLYGGRREETGHTSVLSARRY